MENKTCLKPPTRNNLKSMYNPIPLILTTHILWSHICVNPLPNHGFWGMLHMNRGEDCPESEPDGIITSGTHDYTKQCDHNSNTNTSKI